MKILGLDTSGKTASVAILEYGEDTTLLGEHTVYTSRTQSQVIMPMCKNLLEECRLTLKEIDCIAVSVGPGSYTGLRIGIAAVQGMAMVNNTPCKGVSTLAGMACRVYGENPVLSIMYARGNLFYYGIYEDNFEGFHCVHSDRLAEIQEIIEVIQNYEKITIVGDGTDEFLRQSALISKESFPCISYPPQILRLQSAAGVCLCAAYEQNFETASDLTASYLQAVQIQKKKTDL